VLVTFVGVFYKEWFQLSGKSDREDLRVLDESQAVPGNEEMARTGLIG